MKITRISIKDGLTDVAERLPTASGEGGGANSPSPASQQVTTGNGETVTLGIGGSENK